MDITWNYMHEVHLSYKFMYGKWLDQIKMSMFGDTQEKAIQTFIPLSYDNWQLIEKCKSKLWLQYKLHPTEFIHWLEIWASITQISTCTSHEKYAYIKPMENTSCQIIIIIGMHMN